MFIYGLTHHTHTHTTHTPHTHHTHTHTHTHVYTGFPGGASGKEPTCRSEDVRDAGSIPQPQYLAD